MAEDVMATFVLGMAVTIGAGVLWLIGRASDPFFKAKIMRWIFKKNYGCLGVCDLDNKRIDLHVIDLTKDSIKISGHVWLIDNCDVYREDKLGQGFKINPDMARFVEGVPVIYVDRSSLRPLKIEGTESKVKPETMSAILSALMANERERRIKQKDENMMVYIVIGVCIVLALMNFMLMGKMDDQAILINNTNAKVDKISNTMEEIYGNQNPDSIVIGG